MKKLPIILLTLLAFSTQAHAKLNIVTTIPSLASIAKEVGGDLVSVKSLARGDQDPHFLDPKPSFVVSVRDADLLISVGLQLEVGWLPILVIQSRNPKVQKGALGYLETSEDIPVLEIPTANMDRSMGDVHPLGNPHYWLNPNNGLIIAEKISERLIILDPLHADQYQINAAQFQDKLKKRMETWNRNLLALRREKIITHHKSFSYFMDWAGVIQAGYLEPKPGIPPSPSHLMKLIDLVKNQKIPLVAAENYYDPKPGKELSEKTGAKYLILATSVGGDEGINDYFDLFEYLIQKITMSLRGT